MYSIQLRQWLHTELFCTHCIRAPLIRQETGHGGCDVIMAYSVDVNGPKYQKQPKLSKTTKRWLFLVVFDAIIKLPHLNSKTGNNPIPNVNPKPRSLFQTSWRKTFTTVPP